MFQISRHLSVESGPKVSKAGPGSIHVLRPNSVSDFQYRPVLDMRSVGSVPRSTPASTRPESITVCCRCWVLPFAVFHSSFHCFLIVCLMRGSFWQFMLEGCCIHFFW